MGRGLKYWEEACLRKFNRKCAVEKRALEEARMMIDTNRTIREIAREMEVPKSTVHVDLTEVLKEIDEDLWGQCRVILRQHRLEAVSRMNRARWNR